MDVPPPVFNGSVTLLTFNKVAEPIFCSIPPECAKDAMIALSQMHTSYVTLFYVSLVTLTTIRICKPLAFKIARRLFSSSKAQEVLRTLEYADDQVGYFADPVILIWSLFLLLNSK